MKSKAPFSKRQMQPVLILCLVLGVMASGLALYFYFFPPSPGKQIVKMQFNQILAFEHAGRKFLQDKKYDQAIEQFDAALKIEPTCDEVLMDRAATYYRKGALKEALADYLAVVDTGGPKANYYNDANFGAALCEKSLTQKPLAMKTLTALLQRDAKYIKAYQLEGDLYLDQNESEKAIDVYTQGLRINPLSSPLHYDRAVAYLKLKMNDQAFDDLTRAVQLDPSNLALLLKHANLAQKFKKYDAADKDAREIIRLEAGNRSAQVWLKSRGQSLKDH